VALGQVKRRGQQGRGLAVAGLSLSAVWVLGWVVLIVVAVTSSAGRDGSGAVDRAGTLSLEELRPGDCINGLKESVRITSVDAVPCASPHQAEVYGVFTLAAGPWPGDAEATRLSEDGCTERLESYAPAAVDDDSISVFFLYPNTAMAWRQDRSVICVAMHDTPQTGSIRS
jgi:hypothetical protein